MTFHPRRVYCFTRLYYCAWFDSLCAYYPGRILFFYSFLYWLDATNASVDALSVDFQSPRALAENLVSSGQNRQLFDKTRCSVWRLI